MNVREMPDEYLQLWANRTCERTVEYQWVWENIEPSAKRLLDVGCTESKFAYLMASLGFHVTAVDIRPYEWSHPNIEFHQLDFLDFGASLPFDVTVSISTFEHFGMAWYGNSHIYADGWKRGFRHLLDLTKSSGIALVTMPYGVQIGGFDWVDTPTRIELEEFGGERTYYKTDGQRWNSTTEPLAAAAKGYTGGMPRSIVCIKIRKP